MAKFMMFVSTSVGCWLTSGGMFLYLSSPLYFHFFILGLLQPKENLRQGS